MPEKIEEMDRAATDAENDLQNVNEQSLVEVANWWRKWYRKAGHKRLGRILLQHAQEE